jgi:hypothetical protein
MSTGAPCAAEMRQVRRGRIEQRVGREDCWQSFCKVFSWNEGIYWSKLDEEEKTNLAKVDWFFSEQLVTV